MFAATQNEKKYLVLDFSAKPVDYVAFQDIDHEGTEVTVEFVDGSQSFVFNIDETDASGDTAEFVGIFRNNMPRIKRVLLNASGDGRWGIDNLEYGIH